MVRREETYTSCKFSVINLTNEHSNNIFLVTGITIEYNDDNVLDNVTSFIAIKKDVLIKIEDIQRAAEILRDNTAFFGEYEPLGQEIALLKTSVNRLIAGEDRTLADLFDLVDWANKLKGTPTGTEMPSR